jgi:hypothetical protein
LQGKFNFPYWSLSLVNALSCNLKKKIGFV